MFVQVIQGQVADREALRRQFDRWNEELRPGAKGFLGSTGGVSDDGRLVMLARFESAEAARANSDRAEQGAWWNETEKGLAGEASFADSEDVQEFMGGGSNDAGFVQFMLGTVKDRARLEQLDAEFERVAGDARPDLIGSLRAWTSPTTYVEAGYFTSEAEAREGEAKEPPQEVAALMSQWREVVPEITFVDIREPWLR